MGPTPTTGLDRDAAVKTAADRLASAAHDVRPVPPVRDVLGSTDVTIAYEVQQILTRRRLASGRQIVGRKIGLTSEAVQRQLRVDQPDFGVLFDDMAVPDGGSVKTGELISPRIEAEIAFVLKADLVGLAAADGGSDLAGTAEDRALAVAAVEHAFAALEIVDSRIADWDITITDTVADNASSGMFVLGRDPLRLDKFTPTDVSMTLERNGEVESRGTGAACLGDPLIALSWLARRSDALGAPLRAGDIVLSGALGPMVAVTAGDTFRADLAGLGRISVSFE